MEEVLDSVNVQHVYFPIYTNHSGQHTAQEDVVI